MNFFVINASPKTRHSITLQHLYFLEQQYPQHRFEMVHAANQIPVYEKNRSAVQELMETVKTCDALIWCFPVYYTSVPSQLKRLIELFFKTEQGGPFKGKYATAFTTSINFFDHTAHNYIQGVSEDLGFQFIPSYSAHMDDFFNADEREKMTQFFGWFVRCIEQNIPVQRKYPPLDIIPVRYRPDLEALDGSNMPSAGPGILLLTDEQDTDGNLVHMTRVFTRLLKERVEKKNIRQIGLKNGCLGCCTCGWDNTCVQKDGFVDFFNKTVKPARVIIIAGSIRDHHLSAQWKNF